MWTYTTYKWAGVESRVHIIARNDESIQIEKNTMKVSIKRQHWWENLEAEEIQQEKNPVQELLSETPSHTACILHTGADEASAFSHNIRENISSVDYIWYIHPSIDSSLAT